ncbi:transposase family protein [Arachnia rubra]|uniref:DDE Tnp4 domain-containing protein n=1 Tax=Arachnia rubra TaxID=1547448 RepID=A0ABX7Y5Q0_9ACTN|nr:transposase family protein [Arachnia rubra]QUC08519.1 hypothetical protein J5A65_01860 [Arachnia rubra]
MFFKLFTKFRSRHSTDFTSHVRINSGFSPLSTKRRALHTATTAITPVKKSPNQPRSGWEKRFNKTIASLRAGIEHCIAHLKNWKILAKGYHGRLEELPAIIRIVTQLELLRTR